MMVHLFILSNNICILVYVWVLFDGYFIFVTLSFFLSPILFVYVSTYLFKFKNNGS